MTRATLNNGMRVVIIPNKLAPVATVEANFIGGRRTKRRTAFRAWRTRRSTWRSAAAQGMTADQTAAIYALLGGQNNADTQQNITQYFATVPAADVDVALRAQAACLHGIDDSQAQWDAGARRYRAGSAARPVESDLQVHRPAERAQCSPARRTRTIRWARRPRSTRRRATMLKEFYEKWYSPYNVILVVVGDVDPAKTLAKIKELYSAAFPAIRSGAPGALICSRSSQRPSPSTAICLTFWVSSRTGCREPTRPDYAATQILADVLASQRADLYGMVPAGKALAAEFGMAETYPKASVGFGVVALPAGGDAASAITEMRQIIERYATNGVPADLVDAAKRSEIAQAEFQRNSIPGLADVWSDALAAEGRNSPEEDIDAIRKVTLADVNRVAKKYLLNTSTITATLKPAPSGQPVAAKGFGGAEQVTAAPTKPVELPEWAARRRWKRLRRRANYVPVFDTSCPTAFG